MRPPFVLKSIVLPNPSSLQHLGAEPDLAYIVTTPPQPSSASSRKSSRSGSTSKVSKRTSRKKAETSLASSARNRGSREPSTLTDDATETDAYETSTTTSSPGIQEQGYTFQHAQNQTTFQGQSFQQGTQYLPPITGSVMQNDYLQYQGTGNFGDMRFAYGAPSQQQFSSPSSEYSSRIEDVRGVPPGSQEEGAGGTEIRSQYILATQDTVWRAAP